jgi:hypothetical protein
LLFSRRIAQFPCPKLSENSSYYFGASEAASFWKRGSFRSGSNIGSSRRSLLHRHAFARHPLKAGLPVEHLVLVAAWPEAHNIFDEQERAALAWAEVVTRLGDQGVPDSAFEAAAAAFSEKQLADLTIAIGLINAFNRLAISFRATPMALAA